MDSNYELKHKWSILNVARQQQLLWLKNNLKNMTVVLLAPMIVILTLNMERHSQAILPPKAKT